MLAFPWCRTVDPKVEGSSPFGGGGGIPYAHSSVSVNNCILSENKASDGGGIFGGDAGTLMVTNSIIKANFANKGGGIACRPETLFTISNSLIYGNRAKEDGGGIWFAGSMPTCRIINSILWGNVAPFGPQILIGIESLVSTSYCDIQGGEAAVYIEQGGC